MEMNIIPANGGRPGMDGVFLSGYGDGVYTPPLPLRSTAFPNFYIEERDREEAIPYLDPLATAHF